MHIPDGYLTPVTYGSLWGVMVPIWIVTSHRIKSLMAAARIPFIAMASAFSLIVMIVAIPLPGGTTGHLCGAALAAILLGPSAGIMAVSVALVIQAVVFGDGGVTALAANCFNIAFGGAMTGYFAYRGLSWFSRMLFRGNQNKWNGAAAAVAAYVSINVSALLTALELGLQPWIKSGYFPYSLRVALPAVMIMHLSAIGLIEAVMTGLITQTVQKWPVFQRSGTPGKPTLEN